MYTSITSCKKKLAVKDSLMIHTVVSKTEVTNFAWCKMKKLCIHIYTSYSDYTKNEQRLLWDNEVTKDAETVRAVFSEDTVVDIAVSAVEGKQKKLININSALEPLHQALLAEYDECHIVLNTHGAAGVNDLSDEVVKSVVSLVSNHEINITQISALQCNGLKGLTALEYRQKNQMVPMHQHVSDKPASMAILQGKLNNLETKIQQSFSIHGFSEAYDPVSESDKVEKLLLQGSRKSLAVKTKLAKEEDYQVLQACIDICMTTQDRGAKEYINATNELGRLLHKMKQNICQHLQGREELDDRNQLLLRAVLEGSNTHNPPSETEFEREYKRWLKKHKASSAERLEVFQPYCTIGQVRVEPGKVNIEPDNDRMPVSISALCYGNMGHFTKCTISKSGLAPELERGCTL